MSETKDDPNRMLRAPEVCELIGVSIHTLYRYCRKKQFPTPYKIGPGETGASAWKYSEVLDWINNLPKVEMMET